MNKGNPQSAARRMRKVVLCVLATEPQDEASERPPFYGWLCPKQLCLPQTTFPHPINAIIKYAKTPLRLHRPLRHLVLLHRLLPHPRGHTPPCATPGTFPRLHRGD